ncbi:MAG TPA: NAD(P)H-hydrate epimerase [Elusimicrobiota bacterium]|nr:NAD(P)H-hydrate epimerase [Elusimicrobiota bacterium]
MRGLDRRAAALGVPGAVLMENAGRAVADAVGTILNPPPASRIAVFCGGGNNGGDGLVAARHLADAGFQPRVALALPPERFQGDALFHWKKLLDRKIPYAVFQSLQKLLEFLGDFSAAVDALLGTGFHGAPREPFRSLIVFLNGSSAPVTAVDVPSGLDADTGRVDDVAVRADLTVTLGLPKRGLVKKSARPWTGLLRVADIGFPPELTRDFLRRP